MPTIEQSIRNEVKRKEEFQHIMDWYSMGYISKEMVLDALGSKYVDPVKYYVGVDRAAGTDQTWQTEYACHPYDRVDSPNFFKEPVNFPTYPPVDKMAYENLTSKRALNEMELYDQFREEEDAFHDYLYFMEEVKFDRFRETVTAIELLGD